MIEMFMKCFFVISFVACTSVNGGDESGKSNLIGDNYDLFQNTPAWELAIAVKNNNQKEIKQIVKANPSLLNYQEPKYGNTLLILTIKNQQKVAFKTLLELGADITIHNFSDGSSALIEACRSKYYDIEFVKRLVAIGGNIDDVQSGTRIKGNSTRTTPLIEASKSGRIDVLEYLISHGANVNYQNEFNQTALSESILLKNYSIALILLNNGADYMRPIIYRPDYTIPMENQNSNDKGTPVFLVELLREAFLDLDTKEYKTKMLIVDFLKNKGIDYFATPIPGYIIKQAQKKHPQNWKLYLEKY